MTDAHATETDAEDVDLAGAGARRLTRRRLKRISVGLVDFVVFVGACVYFDLPLWLGILLYVGVVLGKAAGRRVRETGYAEVPAPRRRK